MPGYNSKYKILIVEDSEMNQRLMTKILTQKGFNCDIAEDGVEAIIYSKNITYDMILMDCQMPILDGYEATKQIRLSEETGQHIPIIAFTAHAMQEDADKCLKAGMDDYLTKPVDLEKLFAIMGKYLPIKTTSSPSGDSSEESDKEGFISNIISKIMKDLNFSRQDSEDLFKEYMKILPESFKEIKDAAKEGNHDLLSRHAHKLKGNSANLRVSKMQELCLNLENTAKTADLLSCAKIIRKLKIIYYFCKREKDLIL